MSTRILAFALCAALPKLALAQTPPPLPAAAEAKDTQMTLGKLARIIEGAPGSFPDYFDFAESYGREGGLAALGMTAVDGGNPFIKEYRLKTPLRVFNRETRRICLTNAGAMAILEGVDPDGLAKELSLVEHYRSGSKVMFAKILHEETINPEEKDEEFRMRRVIRLNVSTVATHPGCVFAGCEYRLGSR